ncbi:phosphotransferase [Demequina aurantiaca]|uniref:phosphotransferase n=1 Tax=Demequina aurantiaca TaxID=676200 RepID=UPI003D359AEF
MQPQARPDGAVPHDLPDAQLRALIDEQFPHFSDRELGRRYAIAEHFAVRVGDDIGAVFPRYSDGDEFYERAAALIRPRAPGWTFPASYPVATGIPSQGFPYHWFVVEWKAGSTAGFVPLDSGSVAPLAKALAEIHVIAPADSPLNPRTSVSLPRLYPHFQTLLASATESEGLVRHEIDSDAVRDRFQRGARAPMNIDPTWTHGTLEPRSVISDHGRFGGILAWHHYGSGDPAADLACASNLLPLEHHESFFDAYGALCPATRARIGAFQVFSALRHVAVDDPFAMRMAWDRLIEMGLAVEA